MSELTSLLGSPQREWIWQALNLLALITGFFFVGRQISLARHQNSISHLTFFREQWISQPILRARREFVYKPVQPDGFFKGHEEIIALIMNDLGIAVRMGQADKTHVFR